MLPKSHEPHCPVPRAEKRGEGAACLCRTKTDDVAAALERMVDDHGLLHVLIGLELVCSEKAEDLRVNWQATQAGKRWDAAADVCGKAARHKAVENVSN